ncbi:MAG: galactose mutarotase [Lachnospiraceae bacterium]|nr:galactose mutarotase [Lachnospiraceae bacterium]
MRLTESDFGSTSDGRKCRAFTLENNEGYGFTVLDFGATLQSLKAPDSYGKVEDVVLGFDDAAGYEKGTNYFGATVGPSANRIANAKFSIDGTEYKLKEDDGPNNLHSDDVKGFHKRYWDVETDQEKGTVCFHLKSDDMDMGFPGNKDVTVVYTLLEKGVSIKYHVTCDRKAVINMTNHSYFNLAGEASGRNVDSHRVKLNASAFTPVGEGSIPTGELRKVAGTVFDFTGSRTVGQDVNKDDPQLMIVGGGYDHNFCLDGETGVMREVAVVSEAVTGRVMKVMTDLPGIQFYTGNYLDGVSGKGGRSYERRGALCLETQYYPDSVNQDNFEKPYFGPDKPYDTETRYIFG